MTRNHVVHDRVTSCRVNNGSLQASNLPHHQPTNSASAAKTGTSISYIPAYISEHSGSLEGDTNHAATGASPRAAESLLGRTLGQNPGRADGGDMATTGPLPAAAPPSSTAESSSVKTDRNRATARDLPRKRQQTNAAIIKHRFGVEPSLVPGKMESATAEAFTLAPKCEVIGTTAGQSGIEDNAAIRASGGQAGSRWPLVPQPSLPRVQAESHPW